MRTLFEHENEYEGRLEICAQEGKYDAAWFDMTDCDGGRTITVRLTPDDVGVLVNSLSDWFDVASRGHNRRG
jgi:hypothetical protein